MKKIILVAAAFIGITAGASAQTNASSTATQSVQLGLTNALEITFTGNNSSNGTTVNIPFSTVNDYANGVESANVELRVRSNKAYTVSVGSSSNQFNYTGSATQNTNMSIPSVLGIKVMTNNTGGTIGNSFSSTSFSNLNQNSKDLLTGCTYGGNQLFSIRYKATPGFNYPAGTYTTDIIYTATQQ